MKNYIISVIGYIGMDLTMITPRIPDPGESLQARSYSTSPGGKGANSAVAAFRSTHVKKSNINTESDTTNHTEAIGTVSLEHTVTEATPQEQPRLPEFENAYDDVNIQIRMVGAVGADGYGTAAMDNLRANGVDVSGVRIVENDLTGICFCMVDSRTGENRLLFTTGATSTLTSANFQTSEDLGSGVRPDMIISQLEVRRDAVEHMLGVAYRAGIDVCLNAAPASVILHETYEYLTHLIVNETEAATLWGEDVESVNSNTWPEIANHFLELGAKNVVITLGAQGAFYANAEQGMKLVPAEKVHVKDSTGAGDTFTGAYATEYLRQKARGEWNIEEAVWRANRAAAYTITQVGAQQAIPWADQIDQFQAETLMGSVARLTIEPTAAAAAAT